MEKSAKETFSIEEASRDFQTVADTAEENGQAVILKDNHPKYMLVDLDSTPYFELTEDEKIDIVAKRVLNRYRHAFEVLAQ